MNQGKIFIICGPSGVGKGTVILGLLKQNNFPFSMIPTYTTRAPKPRDNATGHYRYISREKFLENLKNKLFFESNYYNGNYYGTLTSDLDNIITTKNIGIMEQDVDHAIYTKNNHKNVSIIFIDSPIEVIRQRLQKRGEDTPDEITHRLTQGKIELTKKKHADFIVENLPNDQEHTIQKVLDIIKNESIK